MKQIKFFRKFGLAVLVIIGIITSVFLIHPSNAYENKNSEMIALDLIDAVKTPHELGLDYLQQTPPMLVADLMDNIHRANGIVQNTDDIRVKIPLPSANDATISSSGRFFESTSKHPSISSDVGRYRALAIRNPNTGQFEAIRSGRGRQLNQMFTLETRGRGDIDRGIQISKLVPNNKEILVADASGLFAQEQVIYEVDLILYDRRNKERYRVNDVNLNAFCRDALNAVLDDTWTTY
jgi:carotenoid cleavage dioxygenase-like enzyme